MKGKNARVTVEQHQNLKADPRESFDDKTNPAFVYVVKQTTNTLEVSIDQRLSKQQVEKLIQRGVSVMVVARK